MQDKVSIIVPVYSFCIQYILLPLLAVILIIVALVRGKQMVVRFRTSILISLAPVINKL